MEIKGTFRVNATRHYPATDGRQEHVDVFLEQVGKVPTASEIFSFGGPRTDITVEIKEKSQFDKLLPGEEFEVTLRPKKTL